MKITFFRAFYCLSILRKYSNELSRVVSCQPQRHFDKRRVVLSLFFLLCMNQIYAQNVNQTFTSSILSTINGDTITSDQLQGKYVVVHLWGTWCAPCIKEIPQLNELKNSFSDRDDIVFLAVAFSRIDDKEKIERFLENKKFEFIHLDPSMDTKFFEFTDNVSFPTTVLYDKNKDLVFSLKSEFDAQRIEEVRELLK